MPGTEQRCCDCEAEYVQWVQLVRSMPIGELVQRVGLVALSCMLVGLVGQADAFGWIGAGVSLAGAAMALIFVSSLVVIWSQRRSLRQQFMAQRSGAEAEPVSRVQLSAPRPSVRW